MPEKEIGISYNMQWYHEDCLNKMKVIPELIVKKPIRGNPKCNACGKLLLTPPKKLVPLKTPPKSTIKKKKDKKSDVKKIKETKE